MLLKEKVRELKIELFVGDDIREVFFTEVSTNISYKELMYQFEDIYVSFLKRFKHNEGVEFVGMHVYSKDSFSTEMLYYGFNVDRSGKIKVICHSDSSPFYGKISKYIFKEVLKLENGKITKKFKRQANIIAALTVTGIVYLLYKIVVALFNMIF